MNGTPKLLSDDGSDGRGPGEFWDARFWLPPTRRDRQYHRRRPVRRFWAIVRGRHVHLGRHGVWYSDDGRISRPAAAALLSTTVRLLDEWYRRWLCTDALVLQPETWLGGFWDYRLWEEPTSAERVERRRRPTTRRSLACRGIHLTPDGRWLVGEDRCEATDGGVAERFHFSLNCLLRWKAMINPIPEFRSARAQRHPGPLRPTFRRGVSSGRRVAGWADNVGWWHGGEGFGP